MYMIQIFNMRRGVMDISSDTGLPVHGYTQIITMKVKK